MSHAARQRANGARRRKRRWHDARAMPLAISRILYQQFRSTFGRRGKPLTDAKERPQAVRSRILQVAEAVSRGAGAGLRPGADELGAEPAPAAGDATRHRQGAARVATERRGEAARTAIGGQDELRRRRSPIPDHPPPPRSATVAIVNRAPTSLARAHTTAASGLREIEPTLILSRARRVVLAVSVRTFRGIRRDELRADRQNHDCDHAHNNSSHDEFSFKNR